MSTSKSSKIFVDREGNIIDRENVENDHEFSNILSGPQDFEEHTNHQNTPSSSMSPDSSEDRPRTLSEIRDILWERQFDQITPSNNEGWSWFIKRQGNTYNNQPLADPCDGTKCLLLDPYRAFTNPFIEKNNYIRRYDDPDEIKELLRLHAEQCRDIETQHRKSTDDKLGPAAHNETRIYSDPYYPPLTIEHYCIRLQEYIDATQETGKYTREELFNLFQQIDIRYIGYLSNPCSCVLGILYR